MQQSAVAPPPIAYVRPGHLAAACALLREPGSVPYAGGSDLLVALQEEGAIAAGLTLLVEIKGLAEARGIALADGLLRLGALSTAAQLAADPLVQAAAPALAQAALATAAPAIRRRATLGGNICTPHPAGDVATVLLALDAIVETATATARDRFPLADLLAGRRALQPGEIVLAAWLRPAPDSAFLKFGPRLAFCRAIVSAAVCRRDATLKAALGGVAARPRLAPNAAAAFPTAPGSAMERAATQTLIAAVARDCTPPDDALASSGYRLRLAAILLRRCWQNATAEPYAAQA